MKDVDKTKEELIEELARLQRENAELKASADELRRVEDELRVLHEAAFEGIMIHEKGVLLKANEQYYRMFGYEPRELVGKQVIPLTVVPETLDPQKRRVTDDGVTTYEIQGMKKDGTTFLMEVRGKLMEYQGRKVRGIAVMDITERKKVEDALRESEEMLRFLSTRLFEAHEQERSRLSKELHDQLGHDLVLFKSWLRSIEKKLEERQTLLKKECENTIAAVDEIIENVRRISRDLMPSILEDLGLVASIQWLVENFSDQHAIQVTLDLADIDHLFSREAQINLYRIFQEILTNVSKHASATQVSVVVKEENGDITFRVRDNGKGFELSKVRERKFNTRGVGLTAMTERIHMLGGTFEVHSQPGEGTEIRIRVPIEEKEV
ncbi:MAG: PAS domain S-box protein [Candidatus Aminicenantes bacterium]|nr:PAS domain S-box protein [Candidatus Aminicenantes bacterium]NIM80258.1 PAS domain S-box protein [Candidatus Aminicenantes bacterium]NIN19605.1 PAS domain S-box protein [Candidatus Aminicenantes bacterium]NIN43489.1 PAS domain S-box protein [Candidatus Aminicenantes bacterium]NIN86234.1 PAS domain S-box protein [Candidatus Aminicenantes bacterium]